MLTLDEVCKTILSQMDRKGGFGEKFGEFPERELIFWAHRKQGARLASHSCTMASKC